MSAACESCGARVRWVHTTTGKSMPIDDLPTDDGNLVLTRSDGKGTFIARAIAKGEHVDVMTARFKSHFATCPDAAKHRRR